MNYKTTCRTFYRKKEQQERHARQRQQEQAYKSALLQKACKSAFQRIPGELAPQKQIEALEKYIEGIRSLLEELQEDFPDAKPDVFLHAKVEFDRAVSLICQIRLDLLRPENTRL